MATALHELYPNGIPGRDKVTDAELYQELGNHLKAQSQKVASKATVMRAAGRRKDAG